MNVSIKSNEETITITLPASINPIDLEYGLRYFKFVDIASRSKASEDDIAQLSKSVKSAMAKPVIDRLKQLEEFKDL